MPTTPPIKVPILGVDLYSKEFKEATKRAQKMGREMQKTGRKMSMYVTAPIVAGGIASVKFAKDLNESLANVGTLIPGQTKRLQGLKKSVQDLSVETGIAATTISEGLYETISAFGGAEDPMNKLTTASRMAKAGVSTVKESLGLVSTVTKGYGDTTDAAAQKVSDFAFKTVKLGQTTFPELAASMGKVVPLATTLNQSQKELWAIMATGTGVTGKASDVTTQLSSAYGAFITPSAAMTKTATEKLGFDSSIAMIKELGLVESLKKLSAATGGSEIEMGKLMTRKEGLNLALTLLGPQADTFTQKLAAMGDVAGATDEAFRQQTDGINKDGHAFEVSKRKVEMSAVALGDKLLPVVTKLTDNLTPFIDRIANASEGQLEFGIKAAGAAAALGPMLIVGGKLVSIYPSLIKFTTVYATKLGVLNATAATANMTWWQSIRQMGKVNSLFSVLASATIGAAVGKSIYDNYVKPLQDAQKASRRAKAAMDDLAGLGSQKFSTGALEQKAAEIKKGIAEEKKTIKEYGTNLPPGMGGMGGQIQTTKRLVELEAALKGINEQISYAKKTKTAKSGFVDVSAGQSVFGGAEAAQRFDEALIAGLVQQSKDSESKITIEFANLPDWAKPHVTHSEGAKVEAKGAYMGGDL